MIKNNYYGVDAMIFKTHCIIQKKQRKVATIIQVWCDAEKSLELQIVLKKILQRWVFAWQRHETVPLNLFVMYYDSPFFCIKPNTSRHLGWYTTYTFQFNQYYYIIILSLLI